MLSGVFLFKALQTDHSNAAETSRKSRLRNFVVFVIIRLFANDAHMAGRALIDSSVRDNGD
jgi:hypothetical protein